MSERLQRLAQEKAERDEYEKRLDEFEAKIGIHFKDRRLLRTALTHGSYRLRKPEQSLVSPGHTHHSLEEEGDDIIEQKINEWLKAQPHRHALNPKAVNDFLNSNVFFSYLAVNLGLQTYVRMEKTIARAEGKWSKLFRLASFFEALVGALERDQGEAVVDTFLTQHLFADTRFTSIFVGLCSNDFDTVMHAVKGLLPTAAKISEIPLGNGISSFLITAPDGVQRQQSGKNRAHTLYRATFKFLEANPWILWGAQGDVSMYYPLTRT